MAISRSGMDRKRVRGDADHAADASRQVGGRGEKPKPRGDGEGGKRPRHKAQHGIAHALAEQGAQTPEGRRRQEHERGKAESLEQKIRRHCAQRTQKIGDLAAIGVVEAGIVGMMRDQRQQRRAGGGEQNQAGAAHHQHTEQPRQGGARIGQGLAHGAALGAGMVDAADHPGLSHINPHLCSSG